MNHFILGVLPYCTLLVFVVGMAYRIYVWARTPQPGAMTLFPAPRKGPATFMGVVKESLFFPGLLKGDRMLWGFAWIFHVTLALIVLGHIRVFMDFPWLWSTLGIDADRMSAVSGGAAGIIIVLCALVLIIRRLTIGRVREISNLTDFLALLIIIAVLMTGNGMRFGAHFDLETTRVYFSSLATFSLTAATLPTSGMFMLHFLLAQVLIMFIPFSKIMHFGGIFFTQTLVQRA